jgi:hypothetical protein
MKEHNVTKTIWMTAAALLLGGAATVGAQEKPTAADKDPELTPLKLNVVLARYDGDKKLSSLPYTMWINAVPGHRVGPGDRVSLRMGVRIPVWSGGKEGSSYTYHNVGTNIDGQAWPVEGGRYKVLLSVENSSLYSDDQGKAGTARPGAGAMSTAPVLQSFNSSFSVVLRDGQTTQYVTATDPVSGEILKIDVTLNVIK